MGRGTEKMGPLNSAILNLWAVGVAKIMIRIMMVMIMMTIIVK
jgi:hypothetical protein